MFFFNVCVSVNHQKNLILSNLINFRTIHEEKNLDEDDSCRKKKPEPLVPDDKALHRQRAETPRRLLFKLPRLLTIAFMIIEG